MYEDGATYWGRKYRKRGQILYVCMVEGDESGESKRNKIFNLGQIKFKVWKYPKGLNLRKTLDQRNEFSRHHHIGIGSPFIYLFLGSFFFLSKLKTFSNNQGIHIKIIWPSFKKKNIRISCKNIKVISQEKQQYNFSLRILKNQYHWAYVLSWQLAGDETALFPFSALCYFWRYF